MDGLSAYRLRVFEINTRISGREKNKKQDSEYASGYLEKKKQFEYII